jgi:hypothetical protein
MHMGAAALITWLIAAAGGFYLLVMWLARGGGRQQQEPSHLPVPMIFGHFALAAAGLVVWIIYLAAGGDALAWVAFAVLLPVALLGFAMLARWIPVYRAHARAPAGGSIDAPGAGSGSAPAAVRVGAPVRAAPAERHFPVPVVLGHGLFAAATLVLVLLTALGVGGR